jgi:hypothetical protein
MARQVPAWPEASPPPTELEAIAAPTPEQASLEQAFSSLNDHIAALEAERQRIRDTVGALVTAGALDRRAGREQRDVLWWLQSASEPRETRVAAASAAADLASFTQVLPGPLATEQVLRRKLGTAFDERIPTAQLQGLGQVGAWRGLNVTLPAAALDLFPVLTLFRGGAATGVCEGSLTGGEFARSLYDEAMLAHAVRALA